MLGQRLIKSNDAAAGGCTNTVDSYNPFPDGGGVALYQLNGDATDVSGNYDGTATNVTYGAGQFGQAGVFNGSSSYIQIPNESANLSNTTSLSFWFKTTTNASSDLDEYLFAFRYANPSYLVRITASGKIAIGNWGGAGSAYEKSSTGTVTDGQWRHFVFTYNGTNAVCYIDGVQDTNMNWTYNFGSQFINNGNRIGGFDAGARFFNGSIDQVRIFNRALRPYEVEALYTEEYCTPTIVPSEHFNTVTYTGNGTGQSISSLDFAPDLVWVKSRSYAQNHLLQDTVRGIGSLGGAKILYSDGTFAEATNADSTYFSSFDSNGFTVGSNVAYNGNGSTYVAWNFKAGGAAVTNTDGTITSQVSANTEAGFSVVKYFSNFSSSNSASVGHGLTQAPQIIISKGLDTTSNWRIRTNTITGSPYDFLEFDTGSIGQLSSSDGTLNMPTDTKFDVNWNSSIGASGNTIAYCFAEVEGFSSFGSYVGTGASGNTVVTGFEPAFVMIKRTDASGNSWEMIDNKRSPENVRDRVLFANLSNAEQQGDTLGYYPTNFLENGFELLQGSNGYNASGASYIYMAFAADPTAVEPTLEDSFNTVLYTGNGGSESITNVGFQPDLTWIKGRDTSGKWNVLYDSIRGTNKMLSSNVTDSEATYGSVTPTSTGFDLGSLAGDLNSNGENYVAWNWKGAEIPAINSNGSITSVVSANPAAGFSIVSTKSNGSGYLNFGHGLDSAPELVITKFTSQVGEWYTYTSAIANGFDVALKLNGTDAAITAYGADKWSSTDSVVGVGNPQWYFTANVPFITYCFHSVAGFSKFGSYSGNSSTQSINVGFEPAMIILKAYNTTYDWVIIDNKRGTDNRLFPNLSDAESPLTNRLTFTATGFDLLTASYNSTGQEFIYMAFANQF